MKLVFTVLGVFFFAVLIKFSFNSEQDIVGNLLIACHILIMPFFLSLMLRYKQYISLFLWVFLEMSFLSYMAFDSGVIYETHLVKLQRESIFFSVQLGVLVVFAYMLFCLLNTILFGRSVRVFDSTGQYTTSSNCLKKNELILFYSFLIFTFVSSILSFSLGITVMGSEMVVLPYKLSGILNNYRNLLAPVLFVGFFLVFFRSGKGFWVLIAFFLWSILESYIKLSKGVLILNLMLVVILFVAIGIKLNFKYIVTGVLSVIITALSFTAIQDARRAHSDSGVANFSSAQNSVASPFDGVNKLNFRSFLDGFYVAKFHQFKESYSGDLFDRVIEEQGAAKFHTHIIDNVPQGVPHSSGVSVFAEAYLLGGVGLAIFIAFFYSVLVSVLEYIKHKPSILLLYVFLSYQLLYSTNVGLINLLFFDFNYFMSLMLVAFISLKINAVVKS